MSSYVALCFRSLKDFEVCNELMKVQSTNTATSSDGMIAVLVKTDKVLIPHGVLTVTTNTGRKIFVKVTSGKEMCD